MKHPKLKIKKRIRLSGIKRLKSLIREDIYACLQDILPYIVSDVIQRLKKEGIIYVKKDSKKNKKKNKRKKKK